MIGAVIAAGVVMERGEQREALNASPSASTTAASRTAASRTAASTSAAAPDRDVSPASVATEAVARGCKDVNDCACRTRVVAELLTLASGHAALAALEAAPDACRAQDEVESLRAEALARAASPDATTFARRRSLEHASDGRAAYALARLAYASGDREAAVAAAERAVKLGREAPALVLLGRLALDAKELPKALAHFSRASTLEPKEVEARFFAAQALQRSGKYQKARTLLLGVTRDNPAFVDARVELASMALAIGAMDDARHHYRKLLEGVAESDARVIALGEKLGERKASSGATYTVGQSRDGKPEHKTEVPPAK